jgi:signal transduction histidine kinase
VFEIVVSDNGKGFVPGNNGAGGKGAGTESGNGLRNMQQRLADLGGRCHLDSAPGLGTTLHFIFPFRQLTHER